MRVKRTFLLSVNAMNLIHLIGVRNNENRLIFRELMDCAFYNQPILRLYYFKPQK